MGAEEIHWRATMSYGRKPYYIYWDDESDEVRFDFVGIPNEEINAFLYKILMSNRRAELAERLQKGRKVWEDQYKEDDDTPALEWLDKNTDDVLNKLMEGYDGTDHSPNDPRGITSS